MKRLILLLGAIGFISINHNIIGVEAQVPSSGNSEWTHELYLDQDVQLRWNSSDPDWLFMEMSGPTTGYIAIGFSPNGGMKGSDIVMGWVGDKDGIPRIIDLYAEGYTVPARDSKQDVELISGDQIDGRTRILFKRKWNTCDDAHDMKIGNDTIRLIWAINDKDPEYDAGNDQGLFKAIYHGSTRGVRRVYMRLQTQHIPFPDEATILDPTIKTWDIRMDKNVIDKEDDIYFCKIAKFPKMDKKNHLIGYRPLLQKGNEFSIHHIIMYECIVPESDGNNTESIFEQYVDQPGGRCYTPNMPPQWGQYCVAIPIIWTAGSEGNMFATNTGNPLGEEHGGSTYFMFEVHYDNPQLRSFVDSSGFRLFYTENLRKYDSSAILVGQKVSPFHVVPHGMDSFTSMGYCTSECTSQTIPNDGITVTTVLLHAHLTGNKITLRHLRNGKELAPIAVETHYDYNYQQVRVVDPPRQILPGDELLTECRYNTTGKEKPAFGGLGTRDEMCMSFVYYYPKIDLLECKTQQEFNSFIHGLGVQRVDGDILKEINMPYTPLFFPGAVFRGNLSLIKGKNWVSCVINVPLLEGFDFERLKIANRPTEKSQDVYMEGQKTDYGDNPWYLKNSTYENPLTALDAIHIVEPTSFNQNTLGDLIKTFNWTDKGSNVEKQWLEGQHYAFCTGPVKKRFPLKNYVVSLPKYEKFVEERDDQCHESLASEMERRASPPSADTVTLFDLSQRGQVPKE